MKPKVICLGATLVDRLYHSTYPVVAHSSNPARLTQAVGGVAANIARHLAALDIPTALISAWGTDPEGQWMAQQLQQPFLDLSYIQKGSSTGQYSSILQPDGALFTAVCVDESTPLITPAWLIEHQPVLQEAALWLADANLTTDTLSTLLAWSKAWSIPLIIEPVSVAKAQKVAQLNVAGLWLLTPNTDELLAMVPEATQLSEAAQQLLDLGIQHLWVRQGAEGSTWFDANQTLHLPAQPCAMVDSTGAGDAALAGWIYGYLHHQNTSQCIAMGHQLARHIIGQTGAFDPFLNPKILVLP